ncbi:hypothetical protein H7I76_03835 [Mycolicibacterium vaccae]|nr:hypothetical protein [Mycolicibacterium vaccae]
MAEPGQLGLAVGAGRRRWAGGGSTDPFTAFIQDLQQDWITSPFGQQVDEAAQFVVRCGVSGC